VIQYIGKTTAGIGFLGSTFVSGVGFAVTDGVGVAVAVTVAVGVGV
jgi:hypothetical protein